MRRRLVLFGPIFGAFLISTFWLVMPSKVQPPTGLSLTCFYRDGVTFAQYDDCSSGQGPCCCLGAVVDTPSDCCKDASGNTLDSYSCQCARSGDDSPAGLAAPSRSGWFFWLGGQLTGGDPQPDWTDLQCMCDPSFDPDDLDETQASVHSVAISPNAIKRSPMLAKAMVV